MCKLILIPLLFSLLNQTKVHAQCDETTSKEVIRVGIPYIAAGYKLTHDIFCGKLRDDDYSYHSLTLYSGWQYKITAVCDGDCGDLDLYLYDNYGNLIDSDLSRGYRPEVSATPRTSTFKLKVVMYDCRVNPCGFGIAVFGK